MSAGTLAHATYDADHDGVVRTVAASKQAGNRALPALSLAAAALVDPQPLPVGKSLRPDFRNRARDIPQVSVEVLAMLAAHPWPGNVRELEQVVRRMLINTKGLADADELRRLWQTSPFPTTAPAASHALTSLEEAERHHILAVLSQVDGNRTRAAQLLGIDRKTLTRNLKGFGIKLENENGEEDEP